MTEKRSDYRKKNQRKKKNSFFKTIKSAFDNEEEVDVNPEFTRDSTDRPFNDEPSLKTRRESQREAQTSSDENNSKYQNKQKAQPKTWMEKGLRLKRRLNIAILIVIVLIVLVLLALFHL